MEFLVHVSQDIPPDMDPDHLARLKTAERARGEELVAAGTLRRIWRILGRRATYQLYDCEGPDELHDALSSLPLFAWMDIDVIALAGHALDPAAPQEG